MGEFTSRVMSGTELTLRARAVLVSFNAFKRGTASLGVDALKVDDVSASDAAFMRSRALTADARAVEAARDED